MTTLGSLLKSSGPGSGGLDSLGKAYPGVGPSTPPPEQTVAPPAPNVNPPDAPPAPTDANNTQDLIDAINSALSAGSSRFKGSAGSSQAQTNLGLTQATDLLNYEKNKLGSDLGLQMTSLDQRQAYTSNMFQDQLSQLQQQYGSSLYNLNAGAAASGAYTASGTNHQRYDLGLNEQHAQNQLGQSTYYALQQIGDARSKAYSNALLSNLKLDQGLQMNQLQRSEAGI